MFSEAAGEGRLTWHQGGPASFERKNTNFIYKRNISQRPQNEMKVMERLKMYQVKACFSSYQFLNFLFRLRVRSKKTIIFGVN